MLSLATLTIIPFFSVEEKFIGQTIDGDLYTFKLIPNKKTFLIFKIVTTPIFFVVSGILETIKYFKNKPKVQSWSSYRIYCKHGEKPTKWDMYKKF